MFGLLQGSERPEIYCRQAATEVYSQSYLFFIHWKTEVSIAYRYSVSGQYNVVRLSFKIYYFIDAVATLTKHSAQTENSITRLSYWLNSNLLITSLSPVHQIINIRCRAWARNIQYTESLKERLGSTHLEIMIDWRTNINKSSNNDERRVQPIESHRNYYTHDKVQILARAWYTSPLV